VRFERDFKNKWNSALKALNVEEYDFVYLGRKIQGEPNESRISQMFVIPNYSYWTIGYFITRKGAQKLLDVNPLEKIIPVDEFLPIMYDKHTDNQLKQHFPIRNLKALSLSPLLIYPTHYVGDSLYISDTEDSNKITDEANKTIHPKHSEL
jgi:collagen beta-1,O-galactosyltransferase